MKEVSLTLPSGEKKTFSSWDDYQKESDDYVKTQHELWEKTLKPDSCRLAKSELKLHLLILTNNQQKKFNSLDPEQWEKDHQAFLDRIDLMAKREAEQALRIEAPLNTIYSQYDSSDEVLRQRGKRNLQTAMEILNWSESSKADYKKMYEDKHFHWGMELGDILKDLDRKGLLDKFKSSLI